MFLHVTRMVGFQASAYLSRAAMSVLFVCLFQRVSSMDGDPVLHPGQSNHGWFSRELLKNGCKYARCIPIIDRHDDPGHKDLEFGGCCFQSVEGKEELDKAIVSLIREHTLKLYEVGNERENHCQIYHDTKVQVLPSNPMLHVTQRHLWFSI